MSKKPSEKFVTFRHLRLPWLSSSASITAAIRIDAPNNRARVAFAFCGPKEKAFKKRAGRNMALSRLEKRGVDVELRKNESPKEAMFRGLIAALLLRFQARKECDLSSFQHWFPHWVTKAVEYDRGATGFNIISSIFARCEMQFKLHQIQVAQRNNEKTTQAVDEKATATG